ncbi:MAG: hypothetical protein K2P39_09955 [Lachnospiraceae bacterium]|nr:hypothetical protein [Lachnospiraceae bacterium]
MLYRKYRLYNDGVEIMIPSDIRPADSFVPSQNSWLSKDKRTVINVTRGGADLTEENLNSRLNRYYMNFCREISHFDCSGISRRVINRRTYGEIRYRSHMAGYCFFNIFLLGSYQGRELIVTIQCMESSSAANLHIFENVSDSIRILRAADLLLVSGAGSEACKPYAGERHHDSAV